MKKLLSVLLLGIYLSICVPGSVAAGEESPVQETMEYVGGGVILREKPKMRALLAELDVAYLAFDMSYLTTNTPATWTVNAVGGDGIYSYAYNIFYRAGTSGGLALQKSQALSGNASFTYTPTKTSGQYMLVIDLYDTSGQHIQWQSQIFEIANASQLADETTVPGKVKALAAECLNKAGASDYARALWLHDWLIYNANYDTTFTYYYADGVLLMGKGVCQSYALAYDMLLKAIGIECIYVTGKATSNGGTEDHGWNLVKLGGEWYHVDCTWDDPLPGGNECHTYFGLTDEEIGRNHTWANTDKGVLPACEATEYCYTARAGQTRVNSAESLISALESMVANKVGYAEFVNIGAEGAFSIYTTVNQWIEAFGTSQPFTAYNYSLGADSGYLLLAFGAGFPDTTKAQYVCLDAETLSLRIGDTHALGADMMPGNLLNPSIAWTSSNARVATVVDGRVTALAPGYAEITATCVSGQKDTVSVYVLVDEAVKIGEGVVEIESEAFYGCVSLQNAAISGTVTTIGAGAFAGCEGLMKITIPKSVKNIAPDAFANCPLAVIYCETGSDAHAFAQAHNMKYELIDAQP